MGHPRDLANKSDIFPRYSEPPTKVVHLAEYTDVLNEESDHGHCLINGRQGHYGAKLSARHIIIPDNNMSLFFFISVQRPEKALPSFSLLKQIQTFLDRSVHVV